MHQRDAFMLRNMNYRLHFETDKVLCTDFVRCDMNDVTMCIEKNTVYYVISYRGGDMDSENHSVVIRSIGLHSVKSTVSRVITLMGI